MFGRRHLSFTVLLAALLLGALLSLAVLDAGSHFHSFVLTACVVFADLPTLLVTAWHPPSEVLSHWLAPQAANLASRAPPNLSIS